MMSYREYLSHVNVADLLVKISSFRMLDFKSLNYADISKEIAKVLSTNIDGREIAVLDREIRTYPKGTRFYRVRALAEDDHITPLKEIRKEDDLWNPPINKAKLGRLNRDGESLLYTSPMSCFVAIEEMKIGENENFVLAAFDAISPINVCCMAVAECGKNLLPEEDIKHKLLNDFLVHEFIRDVGKDTQYLYRISGTIMKDYYDLPPNIQDGWCYPSVARKKSYNVCFRPESAKSKLRFAGIQIARRIPKVGELAIVPKLVGALLNGNLEFQYALVESELQKHVFPELMIS